LGASLSIEHQSKGKKIRMKKLLSVVLAFGLVLGISACGASESAGESKGESMALPELMDAILEGVENLPELDNVELTGEKWETYAFITPTEGMEGYASDALISPGAHSVVLVRVPEGTDAEKVAADIEKNANPNKWICVSAEKTIVKRQGNTILLIMSYENLADPIVENFDKLFK
jgi:hypothetical protein